MKACFKIQSSFLLESLESPISLLEPSLSLSLYIYIYIYIYIYVCVCVCVCVLYMCMCVCAWVLACVCVCVSVDLCTCSVIWSCLSFCDPMDCNLPGSSVHGIFQGGILEWVAISSSRRSFPPRD